MSSQASSGRVNRRESLVDGVSAIGFTSFLTQNCLLANNGHKFLLAHLCAPEAHRLGLSQTGNRSDRTLPNRSRNYEDRRRSSESLPTGFSRTSHLRLLRRSEQSPIGVGQYGLTSTVIGEK